MEVKYFNKTDGRISDNDLPKIYCLINGANSIGFFPVAVAEDGEPLSSHCSSTEGFARHDIGFTSEWKHDKYLAKYPDGYQLVWIEKEDHKDEGFRRSVELNRLFAPQE